MPKISVIVPVYGVEKYLDRCVQSIADQTFRDFELILVDDGSPDNCGAMCDAWAARDSRIHVIHKTNGGLSSARNAGLDRIMEHSDSEYVIFVDSDDYVHPKMLEALIQAAQTHHTGIAVGRYVETEGEPLPEELDMTAVAQSAKKFYTTGGPLGTVAVAKLYKKQCFSNIRYPVGKLHEDEFVTYRLLFDQGKVAVVQGNVYAYFHNGSSITSSWSPKRMEAFEAIEEQIAYFTGMGDDELRKFAIRNHFKRTAWQLGQQDQLPDTPENKQAIKLLEDNCRRAMWKYRRDKVIAEEKYEWLYARMYPKTMKLYFAGRNISRRISRALRKS